MTDLLTLAGVHTHIGRYHILHGVDFSVPEGQTTMLLGRNGSLALFEVSYTKHQSFGSRKRYFAGVLQFSKKRRTSCKPPQFAVKLLVSF